MLEMVHRWSKQREPMAVICRYKAFEEGRVSLKVGAAPWQREVFMMKLKQETKRSLAVDWRFSITVDVRAAKP